MSFRQRGNLDYEDLDRVSVKKGQELLNKSLSCDLCKMILDERDGWNRCRHCIALFGE